MRVIATRGLPASGKSTWAKQYAQDHGHLRWNNDEFSYMATGIEGAGSFHLMSGDFLRKMRREFMHNAYLTSDVEGIIIDNTNLNPKTIGEMKAMTFVDEVEVVDFTTSVEECIRRDAVRKHGVGATIIRHMADKWGHLYDWIDNDQSDREQIHKGIPNMD